MSKKLPDKGNVSGSVELFSTSPQLLEKWTNDSNLPPEFQRVKSSEEPISRVLRTSLEASQKVAKYWEQKYQEVYVKYEQLLLQHDLVLREVNHAMISRLDLEDTYELKKAELTKKLKLETQRIDRMWNQKYEQLRKALAKEIEQRQQESKYSSIIDESPRSRTLTSQEDSSFSSIRKLSRLPPISSYTSVQRRKAPALPPSDTDTPSQASLYSMADKTPFEPPSQQDANDLSSDSESEPELHVKVNNSGSSYNFVEKGEKAGEKGDKIEGGEKGGHHSSNNSTSSLSDFDPCTDDPGELDNYLFRILSNASNTQDEFFAFCETLDCGNLTRFYIKSSAFTHLAKKDENLLPQGAREMAVDMYETYLKPDSKQCIQLPSSLTQRPSVLLADGRVEADMFVECQKHVRTILRKDVLPAYLAWLRGATQPKKNKFTIELEPIATTNPDLVIQRWTMRFGLSKIHQEYLASEVEDLLQRRLTEEETMAKLREMERAMDKLNYTLGSLIGAGAFGKVYRGSDRRSGEQVAIKVIDLEDVEGDIQTNFREVATMKGKRCPQMTEYIDSDVYGTKLWIVMEYMDGGSVLERINVWKTLKEKHIAIIAREVLLGLQFLMNQGFIHRDIKAANILMKKNGSVKLADFGTSRDLSDTFAKCSAQTGSPCWMAPEVIASNESYDGKVDIWSLGITCLEMALGHAPHSESKQTPMQVMRHIVEDPPPELKGENWSIYFQSFIRKCCVKDPAQRPSIQQLLQTPFIKRARKIAKLKKLFLQPIKSRSR